MRNRRNIIILILLIAGMVWLANTVRQRLASSMPTGAANIIFTDVYHLSGKHDGALVVVADTISTDPEHNILVNGDAALIGRNNVNFVGDTSGDLTIMGNQIVVDGDVSGHTALLGDQIILNGHFSGAVTVISKSLTIGADASFTSPITACTDALSDIRIESAPVSPCRDRAAMLSTFASFEALRNNVGLGALAGGGGITLGGLLFTLPAALLLTGLAALAVTTFPRHFSHIHEAILTSPLDLAGLGCITLLLALGIAAALGVALALLPVVGIVIIPVGLLLALLLVGMILIGWITLALILGDLLTRRFVHMQQPPLITVVLGSLVLFAGWHLLAFIPFGSIVALLPVAALGCIGLGGTVATRLGTRSLRRQYFVQG